MKSYQIFSGVALLVVVSCFKLFKQSSQIDHLTAINEKQNNELTELRSRLGLAETQCDVLDDLPITNLSLTSSYDGVDIVDNRSASVAASAVSDSVAASEKHLQKIRDEFIKSQRIIALFEKNSPEQLAIKFEKEFEVAPNDLVLAELNYSAIQDAFINDPQLANFALTSTACKSAQCRLEVSISDLESSNQLMQVLGASMEKMGAHFLSAGLVQAASGPDGKLTLYMLGIQTNSSEIQE
jgi:hypothetical protein